MYIPKYFRLDDMEQVIDLITQQPLGILVTYDGTQSIASHIPFEASVTNGAISLTGHVARANPIWQVLQNSPDALVIFQGPHTYISPSWYEDINVPTWNYLAIHLYGTTRIIIDDEFRSAMKQLLDRYEANRPQGRPWDTLPSDFRESQMKGIVGLEILVTRVEAAAKMSQNRNPHDYQNIISELERSPDYHDREVGKIMKHLRDKTEGAQSQAPIDVQLHRTLAAELFNLTWDLIEKTDRTAIDDDQMVNAAHASRWHWGMVGTPLNLARGEWQISRVYSLIGRAEPALFHAKKSLALCLDHQLGDFDLGFAYEALARAHAVQGDLRERDDNIARAKKCAERIGKDSDRSWLLKNVDTIQSLSLPQ